jgi:hypothetical protein
MIFASLAGAALLVSVATGPVAEPTVPALMSTHQKNAAVQPLVRSATDCIAHKVRTDPRFAGQPDRLADLIVDSMPACVGPVRAMIDAYDRYFGDGTGEAFFMGPYLDVLPAVVSKWTVEQTDSAGQR